MKAERIYKFILYIKLHLPPKRKETFRKTIFIMFRRIKFGKDTTSHRLEKSLIKTG